MLEVIIGKSGGIFKIVIASLRFQKNLITYNIIWNMENMSIKNLNIGIKGDVNI